MAKGDSQRAQNTINTQNQQAQNSLNQTRSGIASNMQNYYQPGAQQSWQRNLPNYDSIMGGYGQQRNTGITGGGGWNPTGEFAGMNPQQAWQRALSDTGMKGNERGQFGTVTDYLGQHGGGNWQQGGQQADDWIQDPTGSQWDVVNASGAPQWIQDSSGGGGNTGQGGYGGFMSSVMPQWQQWANTGGFSDQDLADIRARMISPTRSIYSNMQDELTRQSNLQGYSPNFGAASANLARQGSQAIGDQSVNANAAIAQMKQQGRLAGMQGMTNANLAGLAGMTNLYGATPGLSNMFGNQMLNSQQQLLGAQGLQNQLGLGTMGAQINKAGIPGNFQQAMGNIGSVLGLGGALGGMFGGFGGGGGYGGGGGMPQMGYGYDIYNQLNQM